MLLVLIVLLEGTHMNLEDKQRLAIARALAPGTKFILLDEPFCSLDMHVKLKLRSELNILKGCNASGLMVTHDPEAAMSICDKVAVMK